MTPDEIAAVKAEQGEAHYVQILLGQLTEAMHNERRPGTSDCWSCEASQSNALREFVKRMVADQSALADEGEEHRAEVERLAEFKARVEVLFAGGPDTPCRTTWRGEDGLIGFALPPRVECVEVPMEDLRAALADQPKQVQPAPADEWQPMCRHGGLPLHRVGLSCPSADDQPEQVQQP